MSKMYFLVRDSFSQGFGEYGCVCSEVLKKSSDISMLQMILHKEFSDCLRNEYIVVLNDAERSSDWADEFDKSEYYTEEDFDEDGEYIGDKEYELFGWPDAPEEKENQLYYVEDYQGEIEHVHFHIVSEENIESVD